MKLLSRNCRGSFTVETAIVFSTVIFSIIAVVFICLLLYQQALINSLAGKAAERGAMIWSDSGKDMYIGRITQDDMKDIDPYWRLIDTEKAAKKKRIADYVYSKIGAFNVLPRVKNNQGIKIDVYDYLIYKKIRVNLSENYEIPAFSFLKIFGLDNKLKLNSSAEAVINEPSEFIRNTDFVLDTGREIDRKVFNGKLNNYKDDLKDNISKILEKIKGFFK